MSFISISSRTSNDVDLVKPITNFISNTYGKRLLDSVSASINSLHEMRVSALSKLRDKSLSAANEVAKYHDTLYLLESRVPMSETEARIDFKWTDMNGRQKKVRTSAYERANLIFCYAAIHSQIAEASDLKDATGLKQAVISLKIATSAFDHLAANCSMFGSSASEQDLFTVYSAIMLAQSQECVFLKAEQGQMPNALVAKVASKTRECYEDAWRKCTASSNKHHVPKSWVNTLEAKVNLFIALTQYYQSKACQDSGQYGERVARLTAAYESMKSITKSPVCRQGMVDQIKQEKESAQKENNLIYHDAIPPVRSLSTVPGEGAIGKTELSIPLLKGDVKDLFSTLIPLGMVQVKEQATTVHRSLLSAEAHRLRESTNALNAVMLSLNLPAAIQINVSSAAHSGLLENAAKIRNRGGIDRLREQVYSLPESAQRNRDILKHQQETMDEEEKTDDNLRTQFKDRWIRQRSSVLNANWRTDVGKMLNFLIETEKTDKMLADRFEEQAPLFDLLSQSDDSILAAIKSADENTYSSPTCGNDSLREDLSQLCSSIETLKSDRSSLGDQLDASNVSNDVMSRLTEYYNSAGEVTEQQIMDVLNAEMESIRTCVRASEQEQEDLLSSLQSKYDDYFGSRPSEGSTSLATRLGAAADGFFALEKDLREGMKFYAELTERCLLTQQKIDDFCLARNTEKTEHLADITANLSRVTISDGPSLVSNPTATTAAPARPPPTYPTQPNIPPTGSVAPSVVQATAPPTYNQPAVPPTYGQPGAAPPAQPVPGYGTAYGQPFAGMPMPPYPSYVLPGYPQGMMMPMYGYPGYPPMTGQLPPGFAGQPYMPGQPPVPGQPPAPGPQS